MIKIILKGSCLIHGAPESKLNLIKKRLTFDNPKYVQAKRNGRFIPRSVPPTLEFYKERGSALMVPRGMCGFVCKTIGVDPKYVKDFTVCDPINIQFKGKLRDYQEKAVQDVLGRRYGILEAGTGSGKTIMGIAVATKRSTKTLVIVHNRELLLQWIERFKTFTDIEEVGVISGGTFDIKDVTVGIINSVNKCAASIKKEFGFVIYDECHRTLGNTWISTINTLMPKYHLGLSATPYRSDKLTGALFSIVGPIVHKVSKQHLENTGAILIPEIIRVHTKFSYRYNNDYPQMLSALTANETRNIQIGNAIVNDYLRNKEPIMVVSDRVSHCEELRYIIDNVKGIKPVVLSGRLSKEYRKQAVKDLYDRKYNILIATVPLLGEGFDAPDLNAVFLTTPMKFSGRTIQTVGRILRPSESGVPPRVYDFRDTLIPVLRYSGFARDRVYRKQGWLQ
ncbi:MAG: hypothetical protein DRO67_00220 [Candidatus Asgardarchaeum californiense]|nr:MAG: hypothetical protein DRO67_00220 [Candidatus Asgardarchaeum californiense]